MGEVWKAWDERLQRWVAIKLLYAHVHPSERARFRREVFVLSRLNHPGIIQVYDIGEENGRTYFIMELAEGGSFSALGPYEGNTASLHILEVTVGILEALDYLHKRKIIHRDITPQNILLTGSGYPKVMDFGLIYLAEASRALTRTGYTLGTPQYMSPEQAKGEKLTPQSDLYSLGAVLYRTLSSKPPFEGENDQAVLYQQVYQTPAPLCQVNPAVPENLSGFVAQLMEKDPLARPVGAEGARGTLLQLINSLREDLHTTPRGGPSRSGEFPTGPADPRLLRPAGKVVLGGEVSWPAEPVAQHELLAVGTSAHQVALIHTHPLRPVARLEASDEVYAPVLLDLNERQRVIFASADGRLRIYDLASQTTINFVSRAEVTGSPLRLGNRVFLPSRDGYLYALQEKGRLDWAFEAGGHLTSGPLFYRGMLFVASENGWLYALNPDSGQMIYKLEAGPVHASLVAGHGLIFIPTWQGEVHAFDPLTREVVWSFDVEGEIWGSPALSKDVLTIGSWGQTLYGVSAKTGDQVWSHPSGRITASLASAHGYVYVAGEEGLLTCYQAQSGEEIWRVENLGPIQAAPLPYHNSLYIATVRGQLLAFHEGFLTSPISPEGRQISHSAP